MEINGISFDCEWSNSGGCKSGQEKNIREEAPVLTAPSLKLEPASRADQQKSPRAIAMNEQHGNSTSQDSLSPTVTDSATPLMTTTTGESPSWSDSASPSTRSPRATIQRRANPAMSTAANGSSTPGRQVPAKRLGGSSIRSRTAGVSEKLREENTNPFGSDDNPFPSFGTSTSISSDPPAAPAIATNSGSQPTASGWSGATTTYHAMQHPAMSISVPTSTLSQGFPGSPSYYYAVTSPSLTFNPYLHSPGYALSAAPQPMGGNIPPTLMHHGAPSPQQSYSPRFVAHSVQGMPHHYHQMPNHAHQMQPSHIQHSVQMNHTNPSYFNPSNMASGPSSAIGPSTNAGDFHPTMLQQTRGQRSSSSEDNHVTNSATSTNNPGTPATAVASYYMSPGEAYAMVDRVTMSPATMDAYASFRPTPPTAYSSAGGMPMHASGPPHATYHSQPPPAPMLMTHQAVYSQQPPAHHVPGMNHQYPTHPAHPGNNNGSNNANNNPNNNGFSY